MISPKELIAMHEAINIAKNPDTPKGPNPRVGCVILDKSGTYLSRGFHLGSGSDHAEISAIKNARQDLVGATMVVTLEPCNHSGKTGPCVEAILKSGINKVIIGQKDSTAIGSGGGAVLAKSGIEVIFSPLEPEVSAINPWFSVAMKQQRPYLRLKLATSLDGRIAARDGSSKWITSSAARRLVHQFRTDSSIILSSTKTVIIDDASLLARNSNNDLLKIQPQRVVLGRSEIPQNHRIFKEGVAPLIYPHHDLDSVLADLWSKQFNSVLVEAGPRLTTALLRSGLVNEVLWFQAPILLGDQGLAAVLDLGVETLEKAHKLHPYSVEQVGVDTLTTLQIPVVN